MTSSSCSTDDEIGLTVILAFFTQIRVNLPMSNACCCACEAAVSSACGLPAALVLEAYSKFLDAKHGAPVTFS